MYASLALALAVIMSSSSDWTYSSAGRRDPFRPIVVPPELPSCARLTCLVPMRDFQLVGTVTALWDRKGYQQWEAEAQPRGQPPAGEGTTKEPI